MQVEVFTWKLTRDGFGNKLKRPYSSTWKMTREEAANRDPDATPVLITREMRQVAEPGESTLIPADAPYSRRS